MKYKYIMFMLVFIIACSEDNSLASDSQRSWCIAREEKIAKLVENWSPTYNQFTQEELNFIDDYLSTHYTAFDIYENDYQDQLDDYTKYLTKLYENEEVALRVCKIDADINNID